MLGVEKVERRKKEENAENENDICHIFSKRTNFYKRIPKTFSFNVPIKRQSASLDDFPSLA